MKKTPQTTSRLDLALFIYNKVRKEKDPPLARYCSLLSLARMNRAATSYEVGADLGLSAGPTGTLETSHRLGLLRHGPPSPHKGTTTYLLTAAGLELVQKLITIAVEAPPAPPTTSATIPPRP
jgi:hypothetical protein